MKSVSEKYIQSLYTSKIIKSTITGTITTIAGNTYGIDDNDIIPGSLSVNNKCVNGSSFELGAVYQGELSVSLKKDIERYEVKDGTITFTEHRTLMDGTIENVLIGTFYISEPKRTKKLLNIKAVDSMDFLDLEIEEDTFGTVYDLMVIVSEKSGVALAQTEAEINAMTNGTSLFSLSADTVDTYRTLAAYLGMVTGTFLTINAENKLEMRNFSDSADLEIPIEKRNDTIVEDYETYYRGIRARFIAEQNCAPYEYIDETMTDGLILDIGDVPIVKGTQDFKHELLESLFAKIKSIKYVPVSFSLITSDSALELGDMLKIGAENVSTIITNYTWTYHSSESIKGVGDNPKIKYTDRTSKQLANLEESIELQTVAVNTYTNAKDFEISGADETEIISIGYAATKDTKPIFIATVPFSMSNDGNITFRYYLDGVLSEDASIVKYVERGAHFLTFANHFSIKKDNRVTLSMRAITTFFESDRRKQDAKITTFENFIAAKSEQEETNLKNWMESLAVNPEATLVPLLYDSGLVDEQIPTASIAKGTIKAMVYAQGIAAAKWDGTLNFSEGIENIPVDIFKVNTISATLDCATQKTMPNTLPVAFGKIQVEGFPIVGISDVVSVKTVESET